MAQELSFASQAVRRVLPDQGISFDGGFTSDLMLILTVRGQMVMSEPKGIFAELAPHYRMHGFWPRPIRPGTKACPFQKWTIPDPERKAGELDSWVQSHGNLGIGLLLGSPFPDGSKLAALDIGRDDYVRVAQALLRGPQCGRIGAKGIAYLMRLLNDGKYRPLKVKGKGEIKVGEILRDKHLLILPPTIHPLTNEPYRETTP